MDEIRFKEALDTQIQIQNIKSNIKEFRDDFLITDKNTGRLMKTFSPYQGYNL